MALVSMRELLDHAAANGYGIPAFNVNNLEQVQAIMEAAKETGAPVIMQASAGARKYAGEGFLKLLIQAAVESYPEIPVVMHQDHGQSPDVCQGAINLGFSSVMMDGSLEADGKTIASYEYNLEVTQKVVSMAHKLGITVEGELGCLGSLETMQGDKEDGHGTDAVMTREQLLTDPEQAADFVKRTQLDALAIAIGTSHGAYKFTRKPTGDILAIDRIQAIHKRIPNTHLVMHGSSSVPEDWLAIINEFGGDMGQTYGVPVLIQYSATEWLGGIAGWTIEEHRKYMPAKLGSAKLSGSNAVSPSGSGTPVVFKPWKSNKLWSSRCEGATCCSELNMMSKRPGYFFSHSRNILPTC